MIEAQTLEIQKIKNPQRKQAREKDLDKAIDRFIQLKEESLENFFKEIITDVYYRSRSS